jgi:hypothetical protein
VGDSVERISLPGRRIVCCDVAIDGDSDDELVTNAEAHFRSSHPLLAGQLSRREILAMVTEDQVPLNTDPKLRPEI